jgi:hypothetical protein
MITSYHDFIYDIDDSDQYEVHIAAKPTVDSMDYLWECRLKGLGRDPNGKGNG